MGVGKHNSDHKHPKITAKQDHALCSTKCSCSMEKKTGRLECSRVEHEGGPEKDVVRRRHHHRGRVDSGDVPSESAGAVMVRQQRHDPHHKNQHLGDEQVVGDVYKSSSHLNNKPLSTALILSSKGSSDYKKKSSDVNYEQKASTRNDQPSITSHLSKFSFFTNSFTGSNSSFKNSTTKNTPQKQKNNLEKMDFITPNISATRRHRSSSVGKILDEEIGKMHRHHSYTPKTEKEKEKERERLKRDGRGVKPERRFSSSDRDKESHKAPKEMEKEKLKVDIVISKERYEVEKAERKHRKRAKKEEEEKETERPRTAPVALTEQNLCESRDLMTLKERKSKSKSKGFESTPKSPIKSRSNVSTEEPITRRDRTGREQLVIYEPPRVEKKEHARHSSTKDIINSRYTSKTSESHHEHTTANMKMADCRHCERERREREKVAEYKKEKRREESTMKTRETEKDKGKGKSVLGFILEKKDKLVTCVTCLSDDIPRHQAAKLSCSHYFCNECLKRIFQLSLTDPTHMPPKCCTDEHIPLKHVDRLLTYPTKKLWNKKYVEYTTSNRIYCPTRDCGEWIQPRDIVGKTGRCCRCRTKVCTMCNGRAHGSDECPKDEDLKAFIKTVRANGYQRCHSCRAVVELEKGCNHITCRCTAEFCYVCGSKWKTCECPWFNYEPESDEEDERQMGEDEDVFNVTPMLSDDEQSGPSQPRDRRHRTRDDQIAEDEALARRLQQESLLMSEGGMTEDLGGGYQIQIGPSTPVGTIGRGIKNEFKRLAAEYAETSKRDEEAREERVRQRVQRLRERDAARHGQYQQEIRARRESTSRRPESRDGALKPEPRSLKSPEPPLLEETAEEIALKRKLFEERAAHIQRYIMSDDVDSDDELFIASITRPTTSYVPAPKPGTESPPSPRRADNGRPYRTSPEASSPRTERRQSEATRLAAESKHTPSTSRTTVSGLPRSIASINRKK